MENRNKVAPLLDLDVPSLISVEYPLRVKDTNKAIDLIGGTEKLKKCFIEPDMKLELRLRPNDPFSHPIRSNVVKNSSNVLINFRLPKRVLAKCGGDVRKSIEYCENEGIRYTIKPVGVLRQNYKFRELADFQRINKDSNFSKTFDESIRNGNFEKIAEFSNELKSSMDALQKFEDGDLDIPPLVRYARTDVSHNYRYHGKLLLDEQGEWLNKSVKLYTIIVKFGAQVPTEHDPALAKERERVEKEIEEMREDGTPERMIHDSPSYILLECIKILKKLFDMKPVWIRRHIYWLLPKKYRPQLKFALPFVSFTYSKGPWRHSFVKFGYDPTKDPNSYKYQIEAFRSSSKVNHDVEIEKVIENDEDIYILPPTLYDYIDEFANPDSEINKLRIGKIPRQIFFDGKTACNSLSFQIGDILDDEVKKILENLKLEPVCNIETGWIDFTTLYRVKNVIKYKLRCIRDGTVISEDRVHELMNRTKAGSKGGEASEESEGGDDVDDDDYDNDDGDDDDPDSDPADDNGSEEIGDDENDNMIKQRDSNGGTRKDGLNNSASTNKSDKVIPNENGNSNGNDDRESLHGVKFRENMLKSCGDDLLDRLQRLNPKSVNLITEIDELVKQENVMGDLLQNPALKE